MIKLNIHEAKTHLSRYLDRVLEGESIILCRRNIPIAEIRPIAKERRGKRPIGLAAGKFEISKDFFEPLPDDIVDSFHGVQEP
jgi:prevent-host-death family protein